MEKDQSDVINFQNVFGFRHELFNTEKYINEVAIVKYAEVVDKLEKRKPVLLTGEEGVGKTNFAHQFVRKGIQEKKFDKAIYIDCITGKLDKQLIQEILVSVLNKDPQQFTDLFSNDLEKEKVVLFFDNVYDFIPTDPFYFFIKENEKQGFEKFILELSSKGVDVIFICRNEAAAPVTIFEEVRLISLSPEAAGELMIIDKINPESTAAADKIISLTGNPKLVKLLSRQSLNGTVSLVDEYSLLLSSKKGMLKEEVVSYYELIWTKFTPAEQQQVLAFSTFFNFIFDSFPIAVDIQGKEKDEDHFSELLKCDGEKIRHLLAKMSELGFLEKKTFGFEMSYQAYLFLNERKQEVKELPNQELILSQIKTIELKILASFMSQTVEPGLYQKIIQCQTRWENALERLWTENKIPMFSIGKNYLKGILIQGKQQELYFQWIDRFINKFQAILLPGNELREAAWLQLLTENLNSLRKEKDDRMLLITENYKTKLLSNQINDETLPYLLMFLETMYSLANDWINRKVVSENALKHYQKKENLEYTVKAMNSLAKCEEQLGNSERCIAIEESLIHDLDYTSAPDLKEYVYLSIAMNRINRRAFSGSLDLIEWVEQNTRNSAKVDVNVHWIKAEWYRAKEQHEEALQKYAHLWNGILKGKHKFHQQKIFDRIHELKQKVDADKFSEIVGGVDKDVLESITTKVQQNL